MAIPQRFLKRNVRTFTGSSLTTSYQNVGAQTTIVGYKLSIVNPTSTDVQITDQTGQDVFYVPGGSTIAIGEGTILPEGQAVLQQGVQLQIKIPSGSAPLSGTIAITIIGS